MTITLTPAQETALQEAIEAGRVRSADELIDIALEALSPGEQQRASIAAKDLDLPVWHLGGGGAFHRRDLYDDRR